MTANAHAARVAHETGQDYNAVRIAVNRLVADGMKRSEAERFVEDAVLAHPWEWTDDVDVARAALSGGAAE